MIKVYLNYPNSSITIHCNSNCGKIQPQGKINQRECKITISNLVSELEKFQNYYRFTADNRQNDMWLFIDLGNYNAEIDVVYKIQLLLSQRYQPIGNARIKFCGCCKKRNV